MCKCTPEIRTPFCDRQGCEIPEQVKDVKTQPHYNGMAIQPVVFIATNNIPYLEGNAIKYICRHEKKNKAEDIRKAIHYLEMILRRYETGEVKP